MTNVDQRTYLQMAAQDNLHAGDMTGFNNFTSMSELRQVAFIDIVHP